MNSLKEILTPESIVNNNTNNNDTYCLRWTRHPDMLAAALSRSRGAEDGDREAAETLEPNLDVIIHLDDGSLVRLHSLVLAAASQLFKVIGETAPYHILLPDTELGDLQLVLSFLYTGTVSVSADRLPALAELAVTLGIPSLVRVVAQREAKTRAASVSPTYFQRRSPSPAPASASPSPASPPVSPPPSSVPLLPRLPAIKRSAAAVSASENGGSKKVKLEAHPMLQSILTQFPVPLNPAFLQSFAGNLASKEKDPWSASFPAEAGPGPGPGHLGHDVHHLETLGKLQSLKEASAGGAGGVGAAFGNSQSQLANILTAAAKLKQVAEQAIKTESGGGGVGDTGGCRKLAFHEPRPCPVCRRMYRDAATLRTHTAIMHSEGTEPFRCSCGVAFGTKFEMYQHKKAGHPPVK